jgi:hypothetical protein
MAELGGRDNVRAIEAALRVAAGRVGMQLEGPLWYFPSLAEYARLLEGAGLEVRFASLFDRPTPLEGPGGLRDWVAMFCRTALEAVPPERREEFLVAVEETARPALWHDGA